MAQNANAILEIETQAIMTKTQFHPHIKFPFYRKI